MPQRLRRLGSASAAVSAGALVLLLSAPAADAASGSADTCKKGVDPETTIENWKCNLGNLREALTPKSPEPTPTPKPPRSEKTTPQQPSQKKPHKPPAKPREPSSGGGRAPGAGGPATMTGPEGLQRVPGGPGATAPGLPGVLPTPEIAADPNAHRTRPAGTAAMPQTRLVSPVAATQDDDGRMLLVAAAAGTAGAVGGLNLSVAGRALRRRRAAHR